MILSLVSLVVMAALAFGMMLCPEDVAAACGAADAEGAVRHVLLAAAILGGGSVLALSAILGRREWRHWRVWKTLPSGSRATVTVEFLLAIPILMVMFATVFGMAEICHAQLVFRYAAFSAARAGAVTDSESWLSPNFKHFTLVSLDNEDRERMKLAAAVALAGLDAPSRDTPASPAAVKNKMSAKNCLTGYIRANLEELTPCWKGSNHPEFFEERLASAYNALAFSVTGEPKGERAYYANPKAFNFDLITIIQDLLSKFLKSIGDMLKNALKDALNALFDSDNPIVKLINQLARVVVDAIIDGLVNVFLQFLSTLLEPIARALQNLLGHAPNPLAPPVVCLEMKYTPPINCASFFNLVPTIKKEVSLQRVSGYQRYPDVADLGTWDWRASYNPQHLGMQTTGRYKELPLGLLRMMKKEGVLMPGDSAIDEN